MGNRPTGAVTFLFTDIEGSTEAWEDRPAAMTIDLEAHDQVLTSAIERRRGYIFARGGDSFSAAFDSPSQACRAAIDAQRQLVDGPETRVRMAIHSGEAVERDGNYFGPPLNRAARLVSIAHGGQILVTATTREMVNEQDFGFLDLGEYLLSNVTEPVRVSQLTAEGLVREFPPTRGGLAFGNLPTIAPIIGRDTDISSLAEFLEQHRLVTLVGAGGIGKTTLALATATDRAELWPHGRWMVDLTDLEPRCPVSDVHAAVSMVDASLVSELGRPDGVLLILDNCEHVLPAVAEFVRHILSSAPGVTVLATSRERLDLPGEKVVALRPLTPGKGGSAVDLFVARAESAGQVVDRDRDLGDISAICGDLGGLPLAIELAAARSSVMTFVQIRSRLADRLQTLRDSHKRRHHHQTIEAAIRWSYDLLDLPQQELFRSLSVFEGGFDLEQVEDFGPQGTVEHLAELVRKSLVNRGDGRFVMGEAVRQFAAAQCSEDEIKDARRRHFLSFARWAHHVYHRDRLITLDQSERRWVSANLRNMHVALRWGCENGEAEPAAEIAAVLWRHFVDVLSGTWVEESWYEPLLEHVGQLPPELQMSVYHGAGTLMMFPGRQDEAEALLDAEIDIHRRTGLVSRNGTIGYHNRANIALGTGRWDEAVDLYEAAIEAQQKAGLPYDVSAADYALSVWHCHSDTARAMAAIEEALADHRHAGVEQSSMRLTQAELLIDAGEFKGAERIVLGVLESLRAADIRPDLMQRSLTLLSAVDLSHGMVASAAGLLLQAMELDTAAGTVRPLWHTGGALFLAEALVAIGQRELALLVLRDSSAVSEAIPPMVEDRLERLIDEVRLGLSDAMTPPVPGWRELDSRVRAAFVEYLN